MNESPERDRLKSLAAGFVVDDLTPEEAEEFRQLLANHPELVKEVDDLQEVLRQVLDGFTEVEAPPNLLPAILAKAESNLNQPIAVKRSGVRWGRIAGSCAALFVAVLGFDYYRLRQNLGFLTADNQRLRQELSQSQAVNTLLQESGTRLFTFRGVNATNAASGSIMMNPEREKAVMVVRNLPAPPPGYVYLLWTVIDSRKLPCGEVKPYSWGDFTSQLPFTAQMYAEFYHPQFRGLIVTLEKDPNSSRPTGPIVMKSSQI
ncbi:MAG: anti-sigma factor [Hydrococcus sp. RU_2_2]|nr:anti-sigma factor [Hydrococcus sp. RU_2_2]NJP21596.1 anti-sigma factor [Hydrococcus sp. CRU_1_1]NJQ97100.1 anti-sigma factor [Hydrococcus sp. CSU_1_8]